MSARDELLGHLWPSPVQEALLKAALDTGGRAVDHYAAWRGLVDLEAEFDRGSYRLLPLLYDTLARRGVQDDLMGRLKGTYRRVWCETQTRLAQAAELLRALHAGGVETLLIKGLPLGLGAYGNPTLRPMGDLDFVVRRAQAPQAIALVEAQGWRRGADARDDNLIYHHAMQFFHPDGGELDLHWHALQECPGAEAEAWFWRHTEALQVKGLATRQLDPTAMLLLTVVHGIRWDPEPPIRWIADAARLLARGADAVDWDALLAFADAQRLSFRLGLGLRHLAERFALPVPLPVLERLRRRPPSLLERIENSVDLRNRERMYRHPLRKNWVIFARYCRIQQAGTPLQFIDGFSHFLRVKWELDGRRQIPGAILAGLLRRLRRPTDAEPAEAVPARR